MAGYVETYRGVVYPWHCDSMGHMNIQFYMQFFDVASLHFLAMLDRSGGVTADLGWADVRHVVEYKREARAGDLLVVTTGLKRIGNKSIEAAYLVRNLVRDEIHATLEAVTVRFDLESRRAVEMTAEFKEKAAAFLIG